MKTAKLISTTQVAGKNLMRCECVNPDCKERWNRSLKNQGIPTTCRFCKTDQFNPSLPKPDRETLNWICNVPASDINFKHYLENSNIITCEVALENNCISKHARKAIEIKLRKLKKNE